MLEDTAARLRALNPAVRLLRVAADVSDRASVLAAFARIEAHYFINKGFFETDDQLLRKAEVLRKTPGVIVQGRYDVVCPMESAWALHRAWPEAELIISPDAGHSAFEAPNSRALVAATDRFALLTS